VAGEQKGSPVKDVHGVERSALDWESLFDDDRSSDAGFLVNYQRDAQIPFYVFIFIYNSLHVSSTSCSSSGETNCINTSSGNCHSVLVAMSCAG
jgi:hypothetical protein